LAKIIDVTKQFYKVCHLQRISKLSGCTKAVDFILSTTFLRFNMLPTTLSRTQVIK